MNIRQSVDEIFHRRTRLTDRFYELLFERCPEARRLFQGVDMNVQSIMLTMALGAIREYPDINNAFREYLRVMGTKHKRKGVAKELYADFSVVLLATLEEFHGEDWDESLAKQWSDACDEAIELMFDGYDEPARA